MAREIWEFKRGLTLKAIRLPGVSGNFMGVLPYKSNKMRESDV